MITDALIDRRPQTEVSIVDAHAHGGPYSLFYIPDSGPDAMVRVMDRCGVSQAVLSSNLAIQFDATAGNDMTAEAVSAHPGRLLGYLTINPWQNPESELARMSDERFVGIKLHPDLHHYPLTGPRYEAVWQFAAETHAPILSHTAAGSSYDGPEHVEAIATTYPDAVILAGHAGSTPPGYDAMTQVAARHRNVILELCGSWNHGVEISRMVDAVGADQVVFGSDFPFIDLRFSLGRVLFAQLSDADRAAVLGGTMTRLLAWRP
jgi:uncharacterized protein